MTENQRTYIHGQEGGPICQYCGYPDDSVQHAHASCSNPTWVELQETKEELATLKSKMQPNAVADADLTAFKDDPREDAAARIEEQNGEQRLYLDASDMDSFAKTLWG